MEENDGESVLSLLEQAGTQAVVLSVFGYLGKRYFDRLDRSRDERFNAALGRETEEFRSFVARRDLSSNTKVRNEIETVFAKLLWVEQRMWGMKRDVYFALADGFYGVFSDVWRLLDGGYVARADTTPDDQQLLDKIQRSIAHCESMIGCA